MSGTLQDVAAAARGLAAALRATADDPADAVRLLSALAAVAPADAGGSAAAGQVAAAGRDAMAALGRRAALTELARATAAHQPRTADEAEALRERVCALLRAEEIAAADAGEDEVHGAFRALRLAVAEDLTRRGADLARLRVVETPAPQPALVLAQRVYGDGARGDALLAAADAPHPLFMPTRFRAEGA